MRKDLYVGLSLAVAGTLLVLVGNWLDLELSPMALLGVASGAVVALVPDRSAALRLVGFVAGFAISWVGYLMRALLMPDTETGVAVYVGIVLLVAMAAALVAFARLPLWSVLLGVATYAGAYEQIFLDDKPLAATTSVSTATTLLLTTAVGFMAAAWLAPEHEAPEDHETTGSVTPDEPARTRTDDDTVALDSMMDHNR